MCGFVAAFSAGSPVAQASLLRGTRAMRHRGPDGQGFWMGGDGRVGMGHARLSIIDLQTGDQPIANEDESLHIVVNGEFYDHDRIRRELQAAGHRLRTASDSEIALHLYEDLGASFLQALRGEFAFALWDDNNQVLLAARDRFGVKPLFYSQVGDTLYVASEIKALFAAGVAARWDHAAVHRRLTLMNLCDETLFQGVRQVPPGHYLLVSRSGARLFRYWDLDYPREDEPQLGLDFPAQVARVRELLIESVRLRLRSDVPVGCYLSGGVDSCAVLGIASRLSAKPLAAFTISFEQENLDEAAVAQEMAKHAGATFHCFRVNGDVRADYLVDAVAQNENLMLMNGVAKYVLSEKVRDLGYKVVLTGEGSDEIFGGYREFHVDKLRHHGGTIEEWREVAPGRQRAPPGSAPVLPHFKKIYNRIGFVPAWIRAWWMRARKTQEILAADFLAATGKADVCQAFLDSIDIAGQLAGRPRLHQSMYLWTKLVFPSVMLGSLGDRSEMGHSIEGRLPMLDAELVEFVKRLPVDSKISGATEKHVLREAARPFVTRQVYERRKHAFRAPPGVPDRTRDVVQDILRSEALQALPFFDVGAVRRSLDAVNDPAAKGVPTPDLQAAVCMTILQERYRVGL
ncbi:MAG: asparagine synthase (glutamine-hydrolyzing) [Roseiarcus sp.]|jgi:asparagine synthase (glutamine-hydrolysing)